MPSNRFLILRAQTFRESDLLLDVLARDGDRLTLTAKNALKSQRRFGGGVLEPLNFVEIFYTQAQSGYNYIQEAKIVKAFSGLRSSYKRLECGFYMLKMISKGTFDGLKDNQKIFDLLGNSLASLETTEEIEKLKMHFEIKYLYYLGFLEPQPELEAFILKPIRSHIELQYDEALARSLKGIIRKHFLEIQMLKSSDASF